MSGSNSVEFASGIEVQSKHSTFALHARQTPYSSVAFQGLSTSVTISCAETHRAPRLKQPQEAYDLSHIRSLSCFTKHFPLSS